MLVTAVLQAVARVVADIFDWEHPIVDQERHLRATAAMIAALLEKLGDRVD